MNGGGAAGPGLHRERSPELHPDLATAFAALDAAGVGWVVLRGTDELLDPQGDVDLLVHGTSAGGLAAVLGDAGWHPVRRPGFGTHRFFLRYLAAEGRWLKLDVVTAVAFGRRFELDTRTAAEVVARRRRLGAAWVPDPRDAFLLAAFHHLLDRPIVRPHERERLRGHAAATAAPLDLSPLDRWAERVLPGAVDALVAAIDDPGAWSRLRRRLRRAAVRAAPFGVATSLAGGIVRRRLARIPVGRGTGVSIALLGPDGSGKSTILARLAEDVPLPARVIYLGLYPVREPGSGLRSRAGAAAVRVMPGGSAVARLARVWRGWAAGTWHARTGGLTLYDRHPVEARLESRGWRSALLARACPPPGLLVLLDAPAPILRERKPEHPLEVVERQRLGYRRLVDGLPYAQVVDGNRPLEDVEQDVTSLLWSRLLRGAGGDPPARHEP